MSVRCATVLHRPQSGSGKGEQRPQSGNGKGEQAATAQGATAKPKSDQFQGQDQVLGLEIVGELSLYCTSFTVALDVYCLLNTRNMCQ